MRVLITGGAGFIATHLSKSLLDLGASIVSVDNLSTGRMENISSFLKNPSFTFIHDDVETWTELEKYISQSDVIFHLAASVGVKTVIDDPIRCIENNVFSTARILKMAAQHQKRIITFSTSEVYGKSKKLPFTENDDLILGPAHKLRWAYAASKLLDDYMALAYFNQKDLPVTVVRLFNTIGQNQVGSYGMVVPRFFEAALQNNPITVYGSGEQTRSFTDVRDVVNALIEMIPAKNTFGELLNIGNGEEIRIYDLAVKIRKMCGSSSEIVKIPFAEVYGESFEDMERRLPSPQKIKNILNFEFKYTLDQTLRWIQQGFFQTHAPKEMNKENFLSI